VFELLSTILGAYSTGIKNNIKKNVDNLLIPDDIFSIGKSIIHVLIEVKPTKYSGKVADAPDHLQKIMIDSNLDSKKLVTIYNYNLWKVVGCLLHLFTFDP